MPDSVSRRKFQLVWAFAAGLLLSQTSGCGGDREVEQGAEDQAGAVARHLEEVAAGDSRWWSAVRVSSRPWLGIEPISNKISGELPGAFLAEDAVTLPLKDVAGDEGLAARIQAATDLEVRLVGEGAGSGPVGRFARALDDGWTPSAGIWTGPLPSLLDAWTSAGGYLWRFVDGRIDVVRRETVTFGINALAGRQQYSARTVSRNRVSGDSATGSAQQSIVTRAVFDPWPEIASELERLVGPDSDLAVSQGTASVTVSGTPATVAKVRRYLTHLNRAVLRPVTLSVHVYGVRFEREADFQVGIVALIDRMFGQRLRIDVSSGSIAIVRPGPDVADAGDSFSATLRALRSVGTASRMLSADVPSLNGTPAQFYELLKTAYLREVSSTSTDVGTETTLRPGEISSGFSLSYTARITAPDEVLVRFVASLRDRPSFTLFGTERARIQLPVYGDRGVQATQRIRRGETLIVSGFRDRSARSDRAGSFDESVPVPEGRRRGGLLRQEQVLLLSAEIGAPLGISERREAGL